MSKDAEGASSSSVFLGRKGKERSMEREGRTEVRFKDLILVWGMLTFPLKILVYKYAVLTFYPVPMCQVLF